MGKEDDFLPFIRSRILPLPFEQRPARGINSYRGSIKFNEEMESPFLGEMR